MSGALSSIDHYTERNCSTSIETNGTYLVSIRIGSSVKVPKVSTPGFFFKLNLNLSLANSSRLSLTLINFFHFSFFFISSCSKLWITSGSTCNHALNSRSLLLSNCWTCLIAAASVEFKAFDFVKVFAQENCASYPSTPPCDDGTLWKQEPSHFLV